MKKVIFAAAVVFGSVGAFANTAPQLTLSLQLSSGLDNAAYVIDADACSYSKHVCDDRNRGTVHDHESRAFAEGWLHWRPNWKPLPSHYQLVNYHISVRHPQGSQDVVACNSRGSIPAHARHVTLSVKRSLFGSLVCKVT